MTIMIAPFMSRTRAIARLTQLSSYSRLPSSGKNGKMPSSSRYMLGIAMAVLTGMMSATPEVSHAHAQRLKRRLSMGAAIMYHVSGA